MKPIDGLKMIPQGKTFTANSGRVYLQQCDFCFVDGENNSFVAISDLGDGWCETLMCEKCAGRIKEFFKNGD